MSLSATEHLLQDPVLARIVARVELSELPVREDVYLSLLRTILYQQLAGKAAEAIHRRFLGLFPEGYPEATALAQMPIETLRSAGLSQQKARYMQNIAAFSQENPLDQTTVSGLSDEDFIRYITTIKGVGRWTAEILLMFTLRRPDVFPVDDYGIQSAIVQLYGLNETGRALQKRMVEIAEPWRPQRTLACRYLWRYKDGGTTP